MDKMSKLIALVIFSCFGISYGTEYDIKTITTIMDAYEKQIDSIKLKYTYTYPLDEQGNLEFVKGTFAQKKSEGYVLLDERKQKGKTWDDDKDPIGIARSYNGEITRYFEHEKNDHGYHMADLSKNHNPIFYKTSENPYYRFYRVNYKTKFTDLLNDPNEMAKIQGEELVDGFKTIKISLKKEESRFSHYVWLLPEKNYLPIKYKIVRTSDGSDFWQINWSEFKELAGGIWFPGKIELCFGDITEPTTIKLEEMDISPLTKEDFEFKFPAFTHVTDHIIGTSYLTTMPLEQSEFKPGEIWTDTSGVPINAHGGGILYHDKVYYWYGEIKTGKTWLPESNRSWSGTRVETVGISCYSSHDLYNWKYEGNVLPAVQDDPNHELHKSKVLERPKVLYNRNTKQFVMWMHVDLQDYQLAHAGVATSSSPRSPFRYVGSFRPDGAMSRDMTVFMDEDGKAYLFHASEDNATMHISLLTDDYLKPSGRFVRVFEGRSMEAPAVFKHKGRYYLMASGCTGWAPNAARSAVAESIWGPWKELGNPCRGPEEDVTFRGQSTFIFPVSNKPGTFILMADRWNQNDLPDSRYLWLPLTFTDNGFEVRWQTTWRLNN